MHSLRRGLRKRMKWTKAKIQCDEDFYSRRGCSKYGNWSDTLSMDAKMNEIEMWCVNGLWQMLLTCNGQINLALELIVLQAQDTLDDSIVCRFHMLDGNAAEAFFQTFAEVLERCTLVECIGEPDWFLARYFEPKSCQTKGKRSQD